MTRHDEALVPLAEVQSLVLDRCSPLGAIEVGIDDALGCVLVDDLVIDEEIPPFANSAMDGFALRSKDTAGAPVELEVLGTLGAGASTKFQVGAGQAVQIMTGAPIPEGADAVAIVERCEQVASPANGPGRRVRVLDEVGDGAHVRPAGSDMAAGSLAVAGGTVLGPAHLGLIASAGADRVRVVPRPRVGVMSTGDELVEVGAGPLGPGQIRDSNRHALLANLRRDGFEPVDLGRILDDETAVATAIDTALRSCDAVVTSGGVSKGDFDFVKLVLDRKVAAADPSTGAESHLLSVAIRPAKPLALAFLPAAEITAGGDRNGRSQRLVPVFGLPGNPVSSLVSYQVIALLGLRALAGRPGRQTPVRAIAGEDLTRNRGDGKLHLMRVRASWTEDGRITVASSGGQMSHQLGSMAAANALALLADGDGVAAGGAVDVLLVGALE